jgi:hypothetical protein
MTVESNIPSLTLQAVSSIDGASIKKYLLSLMNFQRFGIMPNLIKIHKTFVPSVERCHKETNSTSPKNIEAHVTHPSCSCEALVRLEKLKSGAY